MFCFVVFHFCAASKNVFAAEGMDELLLVDLPEFTTVTDYDFKIFDNVKLNEIRAPKLQVVGRHLYFNDLPALIKFSYQNGKAILIKYCFALETFFVLSFFIFVPPQKMFLQLSPVLLILQFP